MSDIKDNKEIEELKESEARYNKPCKPDNLCCACKDGPTVVKNESQCEEKCCRPKTVRCPDIREAKCIPALIDRIYDCVCLESEQTRCAKDKTFEIIWADTKNQADLVGKEVCINTITLQYDCLGIKEDKIQTEIGLNLPVLLKKDQCSVCSTLGCDEIFTEYSGSLACIGTGCCEKGRTRKVCQSDIKPASCNLYIIVEGTAGCIPFKARYIVNDLTNGYGYGPDYGHGPGPGHKPDKGLGFKEVDFFGQICLPDDRKKVNLRAIFDVCLSVPCVAPKCAVKQLMPQPPCHKDINETHGLEENGAQAIGRPPMQQVYGFDANIFASLLVTEKLYVVVKDEVAVYTTPNTLSCTNGGFTSNCESKC